VYESQGLTPITTKKAVMAFYVCTPANVAPWSWWYLFAAPTLVIFPSRFLQKFQIPWPMTFFSFSI
jgi:hypothetical protein